MSNDKDSMRRTVKMKKPNPLFEKWLTEWKEEAKNTRSHKEVIFSKVR